MRIGRQWSRTWRLLVVALAIGAGGQAAAAMPGLYFTGFYMDSALGYSTADITEPTLEQARVELWGDFGFTTQDIQERRFDRTDIGYSFGVGFQLSDYLSAELSYIQMGEASYRAIGIVQDSTSGTSYLSRTSLSTRARGLGLSGIGIWPISDHWAVDARGGVLLGKKKLKYLVELQGGGFDDGSIKDGSTALMYGAGINFAMSPGTAIRAGYLRIAEAVYGDSDVSTWTLSLKYAW